jgi:hypothetical protein
VEVGDQATASRLLSMAEHGGRDNKHAVRLALMAVALAGRPGWHLLAQRALRLARERGQPYDFPYVHPLLCDLARAARALEDRSTLRSLLGEIRSHLQKGKLSPEYGVPVAERALVQIAAGQVATGELLKRETLYDAPVLQAVRSPLYKALAWAEMAISLERVPTDKLNPRRPGDLLDRLVDRVGTWLGEEDDGDDLGLSFKQEMYLNNAIKALPWGPASKSSPNKYVVLQATRLRPPQKAIQDAPPNALHSSAQPLSRLIEILAHCGQTEQIGQVVASTPYRSDLPAVATAAVRALIDAGLPDEARRVVMALPEGTDRTWVNVELSRVRKPKEATIAIRDALRQEWTDEGLAALFRVTSGLKQKRQLRIVGDMLRQGRNRGRRALLQVVAALASEEGLLEQGAWQETFEEILSTDGWWMK